MSRLLLNEEPIKNTEKTSGTGQVIILLNTVKQATIEYEMKQESYYQESHEFHQTKQNLLKLKRQLASVMQADKLNYLSAEKDALVKMIKNPPNVVVYDVNAVPSKFTTVQRVLDTEKIREALIKGEIIAGTRLESESFEVNLKIN